MRITFVLPNLNLGGGTLVVAHHARGLAAKGHHVTVIARPYSRPTVREFLRSIARKHSLPKKPAMIADQFSNVDVRLATAEEIANGTALPDADVLVATWWETVEWIASAPAGKGRKFHFVQDIETFDDLPHDRTRAVLRHESPKIVVSHWIAGEMKDTFGAKDIHLIENAIDIGRFDAPVRSKNIQPTFGFVSTSTPRKNTVLAIEALAEIKQQIGDVRGISFGASDAQVPAWIEHHYNPPQSLIPQLYASCDAWLFTSTSEGFGLPILEAMASRTPVIATPAGAAPQLVNDQNGQLVDFSVHSVVAAMKRISEMPNREWKTLSDKAYEQARKHTWHEAIDKMEKVLRTYGK